MKKTWKKLLGIGCGMLMGVLGVMWTFQMTTYAAETNIAEGIIDEEYGQITWSVDSNGHLTVNGVGDWSQDGWGSAPWLAYTDKIKTAEVQLTGTTNVRGMFAGCTNLTELDLSGFDTSNVIDMSRMFINLRLTELDLSSFDTSNVADMSYMFDSCTGLTELDLSGFDTSNVTNMASMFGTCSKLTELDVSNFDTSNVTDMSRMFINLRLTELDLSSFDMSNVTYAQDMVGAGSNWKRIITPKNLQVEVKLPTDDLIWYDEANQEITELPRGMAESKVLRAQEICKAEGVKNNIKWTLSKTGHLTVSGTGEWIDENDTRVPWYEYRKEIMTAEIHLSGTTKVGGMFSNCTGLRTVDLSDFDTRGVTNMARMFMNCSRLTELDVSNFDTSSVTNMDMMFSGCSKLTELDVSNFNTSRVTIMRGMFEKCTGLTELDLSSFNTSSVTNMKEMFYGCASLSKLDLSSFNTSNVFDMGWMFARCSNLVDLDVSSFDTSRVQYMNAMFAGCTSLVELDLSSFNTSNVEECPYMFQDCKNLQYIGGSDFDLSNAYDTTDMFAGCDNLGNSPTGLPVSGVIDNEQGQVTWKISVSEKLIINGSGDFLVDQNDVAPWLAYTDKIKTAEVQLTGATNVSGMLAGCTNLTEVDLSGLNTENVTNMSNMFKGCKNLYSVDVSGFDTKKVTDMSGMFADCPFLGEIDLSSFDTKNVLDMSGMFSGCLYTTKLDLSGFDMSNVQSVDDLLKECSQLREIKAPKYCNYEIDLIGAWQDEEKNLFMSFPQNLSDSVSISRIYGQIEWSIDETGHLTVNGAGDFSLDEFASMPWSAVKDQIKTAEIHLTGITSLNGMFSGCVNLTEVDLSGLDTSDVVRMSYMFRDCSSLEMIDVSGFDTGNVKYTYNMFDGCSKLKEIDLSNWEISNAYHIDGMFNGCSNLKEVDLSGFDAAGMGMLDEWLFEKCVSLEKINTPVNWPYDIYLPTEREDELWYGSDGKEYKKLPKRLPYSIILTKNQTPTTNENKLFTYENQEDGTITITGYSPEGPVTPATFSTIRPALSSGTLTRNTADKIELLIPVEIDGKKVTAIKENAFADCSEIVSVQIPQSVKHIGENAFANCTNLSNVIVGENMQTIGNRAFGNCENLAVISFEKNIPEIGENTFENVSAKVYYRKDVSDQTGNLKEKMEPAMEMVSFEKYPVATECSDINIGSWYIEYVQDVYDRELMKGSNGLFNPTKNVTRAQFVTTLYRLAGEPAVTDFSACDIFSDVKRDGYYAAAVCWAYNNGITTGSNGKFNTNENLSRQQLATFVFRFAEQMGYDVTAREDCSSMKNGDQVSSYASTAVEWAVGSGLISGSKTTDANGSEVYDLNPKGFTSRAQLSAILERFCVGNKIITKKSAI